MVTLPDRLGLPKHWGLWVATLLGLVGFGGLAALDMRTGTLRDEHVPETIVWYLVAFAGFLVAAVWNERHPIPWAWLWFIPLVFRVLLLTTTPTLSDDVYRYLWEGHLVSEGVSPYAHPIEDAALDRYEIPARALANNPELASPYLPTTHMVFGLAAIILPSSPLSMQLMMVGFDLITAVLLVRLLAVAGLPRRRLLLYLWNPLVIVEIAHGAHLDALMLMFITAALVLTLDPAHRSRSYGRVGGPVLLALATLTRPLPILLLPVLFWRWTWLQRVLYGAATVGLVVPAGIGSGFGLGGEPSGTGVFGSARVYGQTFRFNSGIYHWLERWVSGLGLDDVGWNEPAALTRLLIGTVAATALVTIWLRTTVPVASSLAFAETSVSIRQTLRWLAVAMAVYVLLTPVLHPWYTLALMTLLLFTTPADDEPGARWLLLAPWAYLAGALVFSYLTYRDPLRFAETEAIRRLQWYPTLALLAFTGAWWARTRSTAYERVSDQIQVADEVTG